MANPILQALLLAVLAVAAPLAPARDIFIEPDAPLVARVFDDTLRMRNPADARQAIVVRLLERYAAEKGIVAEAAEIDAYGETVRRTLQADRLHWTSRQEEIDRRLAQRSLTHAERKALEAEREVLRSLLRSEPGKAPITTPPEDPKFIQVLAAGIVKQWKVDRALHRQYGGRVAVQRGGPEPVDAYRRFLEERRDRGDFQVFAPELEREFRTYYMTDSVHVFLPPGSPEEAQAFATPPWQARSTGKPK